MGMVYVHMFPSKVAIIRIHLIVYAYVLYICIKTGIHTDWDICPSQLFKCSHPGQVRTCQDVKSTQLTMGLHKTLENIMLQSSNAGWWCLFADHQYPFVYWTNSVSWLAAVASMLVLSTPWSMKDDFAFGCRQVCAVVSRPPKRVKKARWWELVGVQSVVPELRMCVTMYIVRLVNFGIFVVERQTIY